MVGESDRLINVLQFGNRLAVVVQHLGHGRYGNTPLAGSVFAHGHHDPVLRLRVVQCSDFFRVFRHVVRVFGVIGVIGVVGDIAEGLGMVGRTTLHRDRAWLRILAAGRQRSIVFRGQHEAELVGILPRTTGQILLHRDCVA